MNISFFARAYRKTLAHYLNLIIPQEASLLEIGCGNGFLLQQLVATKKSAIDAKTAVTRREEKIFVPEAAPDYILLADTLNHIEDVQVILEQVCSYAQSSTRLVISCYNTLWRPLLVLVTWLGLRVPDPLSNWLSRHDLENLLELAGWEVIRHEARILCPIEIPFLSTFFNRWVAPLLPACCLVIILIARPIAGYRLQAAGYRMKESSLPATVNVDSQVAFNPSTAANSRLRGNDVASTSQHCSTSSSKGVEQLTVSVIIPARNEAGNIAAAIERTPEMGLWTELIFVEGNSTDDTWKRIQQVQSQYPERRIKIAQQPGRGKGDAMRTGYALTEGEVVMILDGDLTMPPEDLPKFYQAVASGACEFANGSRLVYPMEKKAMQFLNLCANKFFGIAFSWLLGQYVKDTLCGTKVLTKENYLKIAANRSYFGNFDPFGDFDLLFGASKLNLKIRDIPVRYRERTYGATNISRWSHGALLFRMLAFAARKLKFV